MVRLILASASPRRRELLAEYGYEAEVVPPPLEEPKDLPPALTPAAQAEAISYFKASAVAGRVPEGIILAADTVVALAGRIYGKPDNRDDARRILRVLCGTTHEVITGVTLLDARTRRRMIRHDTTRVSMRPMTDLQLEEYLATGAWEGKAGAFGIQDRGDAFIGNVEGSFTNVVGLPMELLTRMLDEWVLQSP